jgi:hypothetical protein
MKCPKKYVPQCHVMYQKPHMDQAGFELPPIRREKSELSNGLNKKLQSYYISQIIIMINFVKKVNVCKNSLDILLRKFMNVRPMQSSQLFPVIQTYTKGSSPWPCMKISALFASVCTVLNHPNLSCRRIRCSKAWPPAPETHSTRFLALFIRKQNNTTNIWTWQPEPYQQNV